MARLFMFVVGVICFVVAVALSIVFLAFSPVSLWSWVTSVSLVIAAIAFFMFGIVCMFTAFED